MSLLSSSAYSIGSSRAMGSMKPRTIMAIASSSGMPRDMQVEQLLLAHRETVASWPSCTSSTRMSMAG